MKKLLIAVVIALIAVAVVAGPVLADGGNASVTCSDIDVTDDSPPVGTTITFSGTVDITAEASARGLIPAASAKSHAYYVIVDPESNIVAEGVSDLSDCDVGLFIASADASQTFVWSSDVYIALVGDYVAEHGGSAEVFYAKYFLFFGTGSDSASCSSSRTVTAHANAPLSTGRTRPILTVLTSEDREMFFTSDGWGNPTSDFIVYTDGIWQVEIAAGTTIQLDGEWHRKTWIEVDDQGNVIGRYGSDGHIIAEEIGLSNPITVTKVG
jgi:hypothetical protein